MQAHEIVTKLDKPTADRRPLVQHIIADVDVHEVIAALASHPTPRLVRQILCDILGYKADKQAVPVLLTALQDLDEHVRSSAADALAKIGEESTGQPLFKQYQREVPSSPVRSLILAAFGAVKYTPAISTLISALTDADEAVRLCAAWALGALQAHEAQSALQQALLTEPSDSSAAHNMREALQNLGSIEHSPS